MRAHGAVGLAAALAAADGSQRFDNIPGLDAAADRILTWTTARK